VKEAGGTAIRTLSFGSLGSVDQVVATGANLGATMLEHVIRQRVLRAADNIQHQGAKLVGLAQQHFTDAALAKVQRGRERIARVAGGSLTQKEKAIVADIRHKITEQNRNLHLVRELRRMTDPNMQAAVRSAVEQMRMRAKELHVAQGLLDPDVVDDIIKRFGIPREDTSKIATQASLYIRGGVTPAG
jgi:hypothetical protein